MSFIFTETRKTGILPPAMEAERKRIDPVLTWCPSYCKACSTCIHICPVGNLKLEDDEMVSLNKCIQCLLCMKYCPDFAIEAEPKKKAAAPPSQSEKGKGRTAS